MKSILEEASPVSLDELYNKDPLDLTDQDIDTVVTSLRDQRKLWKQQDEAKAKLKGSPKKATPKGGLSLDDLNITI